MALSRAALAPGSDSGVAAACPAYCRRAEGVSAGIGPAAPNLAPGSHGGRADGGMRRCAPGRAGAGADRARARDPAGLRGAAAPALGAGAAPRADAAEQPRHHRRRLSRRGGGDRGQPRAPRRSLSPTACGWRRWCWRRSPAPPGAKRRRWPRTARGAGGFGSTGIDGGGRIRADAEAVAQDGAGARGGARHRLQRPSRPGAVARHHRAARACRTATWSRCCSAWCARACCGACAARAAATPSRASGGG